MQQKAESRMLMLSLGRWPAEGLRGGNGQILLRAWLLSSKPHGKPPPSDRPRRTELRAGSGHGCAHHIGMRNEGWNGTPTHPERIVPLYSQGNQKDAGSPWPHFDLLPTSSWVG